MESFFDRLSKASMANKLLGLVAVAIVITLVNYFFIVGPLVAENEKLAAEEVNLNTELNTEQSLAQNLSTKLNEMNQKEQELAAAKTRLPDKRGLDELLAQLNDIGRKSGLEFSVKPGEEIVDNFIAKIPVRMTVSGDYHEIAMFLQDVANMTRIVNATNIKLTDPKEKDKKTVLRGEFLATTYRFVEPTTEKKAGRK